MSTRDDGRARKPHIFKRNGRWWLESEWWEAPVYIDDGSFQALVAWVRGRNQAGRVWA